MSNTVTLDSSQKPTTPNNTDASKQPTTSTTSKQPNNTDASKQPAAEGSHLLHQQLSFDLVSVQTLEVEVAWLNKRLKHKQKIVDRYKGHFKQDQEVMKTYKKLLGDAYRCLNPNRNMTLKEQKELQDILSCKLLSRGLT